MNSMTSAALEIPPMPSTGIVTDLAASYTMRTAMGLIAGPESPALMLAMRGLRELTSMAMARNVLTNEMASAPASWATWAICAMLVTLGDSFTISGRAEYRLTDLTTSSRERGSLPN